MGIFDDIEENKIIKVKLDSKSNKKELKKTFRQLNRDNNCLSAISEFPNENEVQSFVSRGLSDAGSFLYAVYEKEGVIEEATIATWTI